MSKLVSLGRPPRLAPSFWLQIAVAAAFASGISIWNEAAADAVRIPLGFWLVMRAKPDALIGLVILYLSRGNFYLIESFKTMGAVGENVLPPEALRLLGFPVNLPTLNCAFVALRVIWERLKRPESFRRKTDWWLLNLWLIALVPACIAFLLSYQLQHENWTRGMRFFLLASSYFYGLILFRNDQGAVVREVTRFIVFVCFMLLLMNAAVYWSHHGFLFIAVGAAAGIHYIVTGRKKATLLGIALLLLSMRYAVNSTITVFMCAFIAMAYSLLVLVRRRDGLPQSLVISIGLLTIAASLLFSICVVKFSERAGIEAEDYITDVNAIWRERLEGKMFADRLVLWRPAYEQVCAGPYFLVPSGRPLTAREFGVDDWTVGAHNVTLEVLRNSGFLMGPVLLAIYAVGLARLVAVIADRGSGVRGSLAAGLFGVGIGGMATGDFPADMTVGFFIWSLIGAVCALDMIAQQGGRRMLVPVQPRYEGRGAVPVPFLLPAGGRSSSSPPRDVPPRSDPTPA